MYFEDRYDAGKKLANHLAAYVNDGVILALSDGAVLIGEPIAQALKIPLLLLIVKDVAIPGQNSPVVGSLDQSGGFTYNTMLSSGEVEEYTSEYHNHIEAEKLHQMHEIHQMINAQGDIDRSYLNDKNILIVSDGLPTGSLVDAAVAYLKPVRTKKVVAVVPFASVPAIDRLHIQTDQIVCLDVKENYLSTEHYYQDNAIPSREEIQHRIQLFHTYI